MHMHRGKCMDRSTLSYITPPHPSLSIIFPPCWAICCFSCSSDPQPATFCRTDSSSEVRGKLMKRDIPASGYSTGEGEKSNSLWPWMSLWNHRLRSAQLLVYPVYSFAGGCCCSSEPTQELKYPPLPHNEWGSPSGRQWDNVLSKPTL